MTTKPVAGRRFRHLTSGHFPLLGALVVVGASLALGACSSPTSSGAPSAQPNTQPNTHAGTVTAVAAENQYADVVSQIGGPFVRVRSVMSNPDTDPHDFEAGSAVERQVAGAELVVQNGAGYDAFMDRIESANPHPGRVVIDAQTLLGVPADTPDPHLWYDPAAMPAVAEAVAAALEKMDPSRAGTFSSNLEHFDSSLQGWSADLASLHSRFADTPVATTEPVADHLLRAAGLDNVTPFNFQADIMNGVDPSPEDVASLGQLLSQHRVKALIYDEQVTSSVTESLAATARASGVPVVAVYETMPTPGYHYQSWMVAETRAVQQALATGRSTDRL